MNTYMLFEYMYIFFFRFTYIAAAAAAEAAAKFLQLCLTLHDPMDCSPPGSSVHGIFQARVLEWGTCIACYCKYCVLFSVLYHRSLLLTYFIYSDIYIIYNMFINRCYLLISNSSFTPPSPTIPFMLEKFNSVAQLCPTVTP